MTPEELAESKAVAAMSDEQLVDAISQAEQRLHDELRRMRELPERIHRECFLLALRSTASMVETTNRFLSAQSTTEKGPVH